MPPKNYSIHPFVCMCLCDDKVFVGPKELEPIWRGIRMEAAESLYKLMINITSNDNHINQLHRRESVFQYQVLCAIAQPFTKERVAFDCRAKSRSKTYRKVSRPPTRRLYTISESHNGFSQKYSFYKPYQTKKLFLSRISKSNSETDWSIKFSQNSDSCWLAIKQNNSFAFYRN